MAIAVGCSGSNAALTDADNGGSITLKQGRELQVELQGNPSTSFGWQVVDDAGGLLEQAGEPAVEESESESGSSKSALGRVQRQVFTFKMVKAGIWLLSDESSFVTGIALPVDGGYTAQLARRAAPLLPMEYVRAARSFLESRPRETEDLLVSL